MRETQQNQMKYSHSTSLQKLRCFLEGKNSTKQPNYPGKFVTSTPRAADKQRTPGSQHQPRNLHHLGTNYSGAGILALLQGLSAEARLLMGHLVVRYHPNEVSGFILMKCLGPEPCPVPRMSWWLRCSAASIQHRVFVRLDTSSLRALVTQCFTTNPRGLEASSAPIPQQCVW